MLFFKINKDMPIKFKHNLLPNSSFFLIYRAILLTSYFITRLYVIFSLMSSFYFILRLPFVSRNLFFFKAFNTLEKKIFFIVKFKRRNAFLPITEKIQVRAAFSFIKKKYNKKFLINFKLKKPAINF
jgi:hypothetical protein